MIKSFTFLFLFIINIMYCKAQSTCAFSPVTNINLCLEYNTQDQISKNMNSVVDNILNPLGLTRKNFIVKGCDNIQNAVAVIYNNNRYIMMDEQFFNSISNNNKVAYYLILAHEIAHHLNGHTIDIREHDYLINQQKELECDYFAGFALNNLGFTIESIVSEATKLLYDPSYVATSSHPSLSKRIEYMKKGYNDSQAKQNKNIEIIYKVVQEEYTKAFEQNLENRFTFLYNDARAGYLDVVLNDKHTGIEEVISKYQKIDGLFSDLTVIKESLGQLNLGNRNYLSSYNYFLSAYNISKDPVYLIDAFQTCFDGGLSINYDIFKPLISFNYESLEDPNRYKYLAIFNSENNLVKSIEILNYALTNWSKFKLNENQYFLRPDLYTDLSVLLLRKEDYVQAYSAINEAYKLYDIDNMIGGNLSTFNKLDFATILSNKALIEMRLEKWDACINTSNILIAYFPESKYYLDGSLDYYIGRSNLEKKDYSVAIMYLSEAIKKSDRIDYLYYFRGLSYKGIGENQKAKIDFTIACDKNIEAACKLLNK
ncbi:MAG: hypothetical protein ABI207_05480 [Crocinitomicaceae bacterium]